MVEQYTCVIRVASGLATNTFAADFLHFKTEGPNNSSGYKFAINYCRP